MNLGGRSAILRAVLGGSIGVALLWLVLRRVAWHEVIATIASADTGWIAAAIAIYTFAMAGRILRWQLLLRRAGAAAPLPAVAGILITGYAANYLLPARLGEFVRAAIAQRRLALPASTVLGTIIVERLLDGIFVVLLLILALVILAVSPVEPGQAVTGFGPVAVVAAVGFGVMSAAAVLGIAVCRFAGRLTWLPAPITRLSASLAAGLASFTGPTRLAALGLTVPIWLCEAASLGALLLALGTVPPPLAVLTLISVASLSTLLPTAPGYLGSYQLAFTLSLGLFGFPPTLGIAAAGLAQIYLFGGTALVAAIIATPLALTAPLRRRSGSMAGGSD
jgi:glycosyltransferase 2 family protein